MAIIDMVDVTFIGDGLNRPECVVATSAGALYASDGRGGVSQIAGAGAPATWLASGADRPSEFMVVGWSLEPDGSFLVANLGMDGGAWRLRRDGSLEAVLTEVEGRRLPSTNFVNRDEHGRIWVSISTWQEPRDKAMHKRADDGCVILIDESGARVVADGIGYTNENKVDPTGCWLYVHETWVRRLSRYPIHEGDGTATSLGPRETVTEYGEGDFPDGFEFDADGHVWATCVVSNRVLRVAPDGRITVVLDASDPALVAEAEAAWNADRLSRDLLVQANSSPLGNSASICFGGPDLRTAYIGSLGLDRVATFRSPVSGAVPPHWRF